MRKGQDNRTLSGVMTDKEFEEFKQKVLHESLESYRLVIMDFSEMNKKHPKRKLDLNKKES